MRKFLTSCLAAVLAVVATPMSAQAAMSLGDNFSTYPVGRWAQGSTHGNWHVDYDGYGSVDVLEPSAGQKVLRISPRSVSSLDQTSAVMVSSVDSFTRPTQVYAEYRTVEQLRRGAPPNAWEVGWLAFNHTDDESFYYVVLKPNGWELGKVDDARANPRGPECTWPEYVNCKYPGAQRFLATGSSAKFPVGSWISLDIDLSYSSRGTTIVVNARKDSGEWQRLGSYTDTVNPYMSGKVGLYTEDAKVDFGYVQVDEAPDGCTFASGASRPC